MNRFPEMLNHLRTQKGLTLDKLSEDLGISKATLSMYENGKRYPRLEMEELLADYFNVSMSTLRGEPNGSGFRIPVVGHVQAGIPTEAVEDVVDWEEIPQAMAQRGDYIGLKVRDSSMEPRFVEGDTVIVRRQPDIESGEIAIVFVNGDEATMKKVLKQENGITLIALNSTVYEPHYYTNQQIAELPITIYGKVVELRGKF